MTIKGLEIDILKIIRNIEDKFNNFRMNVDWYRYKAKDFYEEYGHFPSHKEDRKIYAWVIQWWGRTYLTNPQKYQDMTQLLVDIGYEHKSWSVANERKWEANYSKAKHWYEQYGSLLGSSSHLWAVRWL